MAQEVILNVQANTQDAIKSIEGINKELNKAQGTSEDLSNSLNDVSVSGDKAASSLDDVAGNGGAMAILDSLTGGLATRLRDAYEATKLFNVSLKGTKTALIATGIGAVAVVLGTIAAYWDEITDFINGTSDALKLNIELNKKNLVELDHQVTQLELQKSIIEANGGSTAEINKKIEEAILLRQEENRLLTENLKTQLEQEQAEVRNVSFLEQAKIQLLETLGLRELAAKAQAEALIGTQEERDALAELNAQIRESETKQLEFESKLAALRKAERDKAAEEELARREQGLEAVGFNLGAATKELDERQQILDQKLRQEGAYTENLKSYSNIRKELTEAEIELSNREAEAKRQNLNAVGNALSNFASLVGEQTGAGKAAAIAATLISTYQSAQSSYNSLAGIPIVGPALGAAAAAVAVASGLKQIQAIKSVKIPKERGGSNILAPSASSLTAVSQAPTFNVVGGGAQNQLAGLLADQTQKPVKAYVVSNEVTTAQSLDRNIVESATLG